MPEPIFLEILEAENAMAVVRNERLGFVGVITAKDDSQRPSRLYGHYLNGRTSPLTMDPRSSSVRLNYDEKHGEKRVLLSGDDLAQYVVRQQASLRTIYSVLSRRPDSDLDLQVEHELTGLMAVAD